MAVPAALAFAAISLHGCGGGPPPGPSPTPSPPTPSPTPTSGYDGNPPFMLQEVGMKGIAYNPLYLQNPSCLDKPGSGDCHPIFNDDVSAPWAENMWCADGRGDLKTMATLGANTVRLYGNDQRFDKGPFMEESLKNNMKVVTGISAYPYDHDGSGCAAGGDCFETIKGVYSSLLTTGGFAKDGYYHNALEIMSLFNEPDINLWSIAGFKNMMKAMVSAFDGVLEAEKIAKIKPWTNGELPKLTISWSDADLVGQHLCDTSASFIKNTATECGPSLGWIANFYYVVHDPSLVDYTPKSDDLAKRYQERWIHSFQAFKKEDAFYKQNILKGSQLDSVKGFKFYLGEYNPAVDVCGDKPSCDKYGETQLQEDFETLLTDPKFKNLDVIGATFFSFSKAYEKNSPHEWNYGLFEYKKDAPWHTGYIEGDVAKNHPINCLDWMTLGLGKGLMQAFGGSQPTLSCPPSLFFGNWTEIV